MKHATNHWEVLIPVALCEGTHRFGDLRRKIGRVSEKMLAQPLRALEQDGFLNRIAYPAVPPHMEYGLTSLGGQVSGEAAALAGWTELNSPEMLAIRDERATQLPDALRLSGLRFTACRTNKMRQHRICRQMSDAIDDLQAEKEVFYLLRST